MSDARLATVFRELTSLGVQHLVMGGHAVRFYGVDRSTLDYDFCVAASDQEWADLPELLAQSRLFHGGGIHEGPSWRPDAFRRFVIGALPDGREERLELWRKNHLLPAFADLAARRGTGVYGGEALEFLGIDDLIRSKETERDDDWRDVLLLEEIADERRMVAAHTSADRIDALAHLRSRRGFERARSAGWLDGGDEAVRALRSSAHVISRALLAPIT